VCLAHLITESWIKNIWLACQKCDIHLQINIQNLYPCRMQDIKITGLFLQYGYWMRGELQVLNQCQLYLQAIWLSDICTGLGQHICKFAWKGDGKCESKYWWPLMAHPSKGEWQCWQQALVSSRALDCWHQLGTSLGPWLKDGKLQGWYYKQVSDQLWHVNMGQWEFFSIYLQWSLMATFITTSPVPTTQLPAMAALHHTSVTKHGNQWALTGDGDVMRKVEPLKS